MRGKDSERWMIRQIAGRLQGEENVKKDNRRIERKRKKKTESGG